jgi:hypothetical protein
VEAGLSSDAKVCIGLSVIRRDLGKGVLPLMPYGTMEFDATSCEPSSQYARASIGLAIKR